MRGEQQNNLAKFGVRDKYLYIWIFGQFVCELKTVLLARTYL